MSGCMNSSLYLIHTSKCVYQMHDWLILLQCSDLSHCPVIACHCKIWLGRENHTIFVKSAVQNLCLLSASLHIVQINIYIFFSFIVSSFLKKKKKLVLIFYTHDLDTGLLLSLLTVCTNEHKVGKSHSSLQELQQSLKKESCSEQEHNAEYNTHIFTLS